MKKRVSDKQKVYLWKEEQRKKVLKMIKVSIDLSIKEMERCGAFVVKNMAT